MSHHTVCCIDFETYYDDEYSLKKLSTTDYIRHPLFNVHSVVLQWEDGRVVHAGAADVVRVLQEVDWASTGVVAHHAQFDGLILTHHFGHSPAFWYDTISMARNVLGVDVAFNLDALARRLGFEGKQHGEALGATKGKRELTAHELEDLLTYNTFDVEQTMKVFKKLLPFVSERELRTIDTTIRMYAEPVLHIDAGRVERLLEEERAHKRALFSKVEGAEWLSSAPAMAAKLLELGVEPPMKISARTGKPIYAFAQSDIEFKALLEHPVDAVRNLVEARLGVKSTLIETRATTILRRAGLPTPIYLNYCGARTGRWSGGDGANWQNLPRRGRGAELRKSLMAPPGCVLVIGDASQIEARLLAWAAGEEEIIDAFAAGEDVYALTASMIYDREIDPVVDIAERFVGKVFTLGAGYGAGPKKMHHMLRVGQFGPPVVQDYEKTEEQTQAWRTARMRTVHYWRAAERHAQAAFFNGAPMPLGAVQFELSANKRDGLIVLPDGMRIRYTDVYIDTDSGQMCYTARKGPVKLYGGILTENIIQALARAVLVEHMDNVCAALPYLRIATTTHDEIVGVVPAQFEEQAAQTLKQCMTVPPAWATGLPLDAKVHTSRIYDKV